MPHQPTPDLSKPFCYYVPEDQDTKLYGGFVPSVVIENESGHYPMLGNGAHASPWVWGDTHEKAQQIADQVNAKRGVSKAEAERIVDSSMAAAIKRAGGFAS